MSKKPFPFLHPTRDTLMRLYVKGNIFRRKNEDLWDYIKGRCGDERFFLQLSRSGDPREYANECLQEALETAQDLATGPPTPEPL